jgi:hypothetical protein
VVPKLRDLKWDSVFVMLKKNPKFGIILLLMSVVESGD